jgi:hypothetical protein
MHPFSITFITSAFRRSASIISGCSGAKFFHHTGKLLEGYLAVSIGINLLDDVIHSILA